MNPFTVARPVILASNSPRRKQLLNQAGLIFEVKSKNVKEDYSPNLKREAVPLYLARIKAEAFKDEIKDELIISADTIVLLNDKIIEKPEGYQGAVEMLKELSGQKHEVITGVCLYSTQKQISFFEITDVYFNDLTEEEIEYYVSNYKPFDKAGAYGIQEWIGLIGIRKIVGSYHNVMGLPVLRLYEELKKFY